jgi:hypothetical protein
MQGDLPQMRPTSMFEKIDALPSPQRHRSVYDRNCQIGACQSGSYVSGHVVGTLVVVGIPVGVFRGNRREKLFKIRARLGRGVFLDEERGGGVAAEEGQQPDLDGLTALPIGNLARNLQKTATHRLEAKDVGCLTQGPKRTFPWPSRLRLAPIAGERAEWPRPAPILNRKTRQGKTASDPSVSKP